MKDDGTGSPTGELPEPLPSPHRANIALIVVIRRERSITVTPQGVQQL